MGRMVARWGGLVNGPKWVGEFGSSRGLGRGLRMAIVSNEKRPSLAQPKAGHLRICEWSGALLMRRGG